MSPANLILEYSVAGNPEEMPVQPPAIHQIKKINLLREAFWRILIS